MVIRAFQPGDAQRLYAIHAEPAVQKWIPNESYADPEEAEQAIRFFTDRVDRGRLPYVLAVTLRQNGELIGDVGINEIEGKKNEVEIGFVIGAQHSGKGYATELVQGMTAYALSRFGIGVLYGRVLTGNVASGRVLEKSGFTFAQEEWGAPDDPYGHGMLVYRFANESLCPDAGRIGKE